MADAEVLMLQMHIVKNVMCDQGVFDGQTRIPLILGIWGGKGQGKTFQTELAFKKLGSVLFLNASSFSGTSPRPMTVKGTLISLSALLLCHFSPWHSQVVSRDDIPSG